MRARGRESFARPRRARATGARARALSAHVAATFFERQLYDGSRSAMTSGGGRFGAGVAGPTDG